LGRAADAEDFAGIVRGKIAAAVVLQPLARFAVGLPHDARADGIAVTDHALKLQAEPIVPLGGVIFQQHGSAAVDADEHVQCAIIIVVADGEAARRKVFVKDGAGAFADVMEQAVCAVMEQQQRLFVFHLHGVGVDHVVGMAVGEEEVDEAVVIVVEIFQAPAAQQARGARDAIGLGHVAKRFVFIVFVDRKHFVIDVGDEEVLIAAAAEVGGVHAHAGARTPGVTEAYAGLQSDFVPFPGASRAGAAVDEKKILDGVVGDEEVHVAVVVDVRGDHAEALAKGFGDGRALAHFGEGAVAIVVVEEAGGGLEDSRHAVIVVADLVAAAFELFDAGVVDEAADEEVELAIIVVIEPDGAGGPAWSGEPGFFGDVSERAVLVVFVQDAFAVGGDEQVRPAVVVVIPDGDAHAEVGAGDADFFGDVGEAAVAIIFVEGVADGLGGGRRPKIAGAAVDEEDVHPAVVVEVEKCDAGAEGFGEIAAG